MRRRWWAVLTLAVILVGTFALNAARSPEPDAPTSPNLPSAVGAPTTGGLSAGCVNAPDGWLSREAGRTEGVVPLPPVTALGRTVGSVIGYLDRPDARCGRPFGLHLSARSTRTASVEVLRVGSYSGGAARVLWRSDAVSVGPHEYHRPEERRTATADWPVSATVTPTPEWPPGMYLVRFGHPGPAADWSYAPFYLGANGPRPAMLAIGSDLTQLAYNPYGGVSLYAGPGPDHATQVAARGYHASPARPLTGGGLVKAFMMDVPLAWFLDRHGLVADWTCDSAVDGDPTLLDRRSAILLPGHSEYWTKTGYDALERVVRSGTNLAVLGSNEIFWQARLTRDPAGEVTEMTVYREAALDPVTDRSLTTVRWKEPPLLRDPARLTGLSLSGVGIRGDALVRSTPQWAFSGTGVVAGDTLPYAFGHEGNGPDRGAPTNLQLFLTADVVNQYGVHLTMATSYLDLPGGAGVFNAGTTEWLCTISNSCPEGPRDPTVSRVLDQLTANVLAAFGHPRAGSVHPALPGPVLPPAQLPPSTSATAEPLD